MAEASNPQKSKFIATFRLKPSQSFAGLKAQVTTGDGYALSFHDDMAWIRFDATSDEWQRRLDIGRQALRTLLAILTIQTEYPFDLEPIQWIEDKPRDKEGDANYVLGRLGPELSIQNEAPPITLEHINISAIYAHLAGINPHYKYALLDYSLALSIPREAIVFCARSSEWVKNYFGTRDKMRKGLVLPQKYLNQFFQIANDTVIARHAKPTRPPTISEIRYCVIFNRFLLDRFSVNIWHSQSKALPPDLAYPKDKKAPVDLFRANNPGLIETLTQILSSELA